MVRSTELFQQWRLAEQEAVRVERLLRSANLAYAADEGPFPSTALVAECRQRRQLAKLLFLQALSAAEGELVLQRLRGPDHGAPVRGAGPLDPSSTPASSDLKTSALPARRSYGA